jgi:hypothetical protein
MKRSTITAVIGALFFFAVISANAETVQFNAGMTAATGITGLAVGGTVYDVDFTGSISHIDWASMLDVNTLAEADAIAEAIGIALDNAGVALIEFDLPSGGVFAHTSVSLWYDSTATSLLGVAIAAGGGWGTFVGSSNAPLNTSFPFAIDLTQGDEVDTDADGVADSADNCLATANADQTDSDGDDFGNACDADFNNDCIVNAADLGEFKTAFFSQTALFDLDGDGVVNAGDLGLLRLMFFQPPGPSGTSLSCN